jgi:hypothetical protein
MAIEGEIVIRPATLLELYDRGFTKLVGIGKNGLPCMKWGKIYDKANYWTKEKLIGKAADFKHGVATCFGDTGLKDDQGTLYNVNIDIDSDSVYDRLIVLQNPGPKCSLTKKIFEQGCVVKTKKPKGYQIHWLSHKQHRPIHTGDCKPGFEFEIHTDKSSGTGMLPPSRHRKDPNFEYTWATNLGIPTSDNFYDVVLEVLNDCLVQKPLGGYQSSGKEESKQDSGPSGPKDDSGNGNGKSDGLQLKDEDVERIRSLIQPIYKQGYRNPIAFSLSCVFRRQGFSKDSIIAVIEKLARNDEHSQETDVRSAISVVENVFKEDITIIASNEYLRNVIYSVIGSRNKANKIFVDIFKIINSIRNQRPKEEQQSQEDWLAANVMAEYVCLATRDNGELFIYDEKRGVYLKNQEWRIRHLCRSIDHDVSTYTINEVINRVKDLNYIDRSKFDSNNDIINVRNGLLNIHTLEFKEHSYYVKLLSTHINTIPVVTVIAFLILVLECNIHD